MKHFKVLYRIVSSIDGNTVRAGSTFVRADDATKARHAAVRRAHEEDPYADPRLDPRIVITSCEETNEDAWNRRAGFHPQRHDDHRTGHLDRRVLVAVGLGGGQQGALTWHDHRCSTTAPTTYWPQSAPTSRMPPTSATSWPRP